MKLVYKKIRGLKEYLKMCRSSGDFENSIGVASGNSRKTNKKYRVSIFIKNFIIDNDCLE